jgi:hypothetical protein
MSNDFGISEDAKKKILQNAKISDRTQAQVQLSTVSLTFPLKMSKKNLEIQVYSNSIVFFD